MAKRAFGELESEICCILRDGQRHTVKFVHHALGQKDNYNTIMTVMTRLADKGMLCRERVGLQYEYWTAASISPASLVDNIRKKFAGMKTTELVGYLIQSADDLTDEDLRQIELQLERARNKP